MERTKADCPCSCRTHRSLKPSAAGESSGITGRSGTAAARTHRCWLKQLGKPGFTRWLHCLQMAGTPGVAAEVAELVKVSEEIEEIEGVSEEL